MKYCLRCCMPENVKPGIIFDDVGVCSGCRVWEKRQKINWNERKEVLKDTLEKYKKIARENDAPYDCIIPVSGGKDSHYQAHLATEVYKMRPLLVSYNHAFFSRKGEKNLKNMLEKFGSDMLRYSTNPQTAKKLSLYMLKKVGDINWHYHAGIMTFPIQVAVQYKIPLILWGEHGESYKYGMYDFDDHIEFTKKHRQEHHLRGFEPEDILDDPENKDITRTDLAPFFYPSDDEIDSVGVRGIYVSDYDPWDQVKNTELVIKKYGFETRVNSERGFNLAGSIDDQMEITHSYLRYLKFGHGRCTDHSSIEIRNQRISREEGIAMIEKYEYLQRPKNLDVFLNFAGITEKEFENSIEHLRDLDVWEKNSGKWIQKDWVGNHKNDEGIENVRLPLKRDPNYSMFSNIDSSTNGPYEEEEELIFQ